MNAVVRKSAVVAARATRPAASKQQKRGIVDWMTSYPDKVMATKKVQMTGGTCQGEMNPTWLKQPGDALPLAVGAALIGFGGVNCVIGHYRMATGTGKMDL